MFQVSIDLAELGSSGDYLSIRYRATGETLEQAEQALCEQLRASKMMIREVRHLGVMMNLSDLARVPDSLPENYQLFVLTIYSSLEERVRYFALPKGQSLKVIKDEYLSDDEPVKMKQIHEDEFEFIVFPEETLVPFQKKWVKKEKR